MLFKTAHLSKSLVTSKSQVTFRYDCLRGVFNSIIYMGLMTIHGLISIRYFDAPSWLKGFIWGSDNVGRLIAPFILILGAKTHFQSSHLTSLFYIASAVTIIIAAMAPSLAIYALAIIVTQIIFTQPPQLMLHVYSTNYLASERGKLVSIMFLIGLTVGTFFSSQIGRWLDINLNYFRLVLTILAISALLAAFVTYQIPSESFKNQITPRSIWHNLSLLWKDRLFGWLIIGYIILGVGNMMVHPIRVEYMARQEFNIFASNKQIVFITVVVPGISMIVFTRVWGWLFDRLHFITTRLLVNAAFIISYITFFISTNLTLLTISSIFNGMATAAGMILWQLWVTKIAPQNQVSAYMSVHSATSGVKGLIAPQLGYFLLYLTNPFTVGIIAALLMTISCLIFIFVRKNPRIL